MAGACQIRRATQADVGAVSAIEREVFADPWSDGWLSRALEGVFMVALEGPVVIGYIMARAAADQGEILNLAVAPGRRGRGYGSALLAAATQELASCGVRDLFLEVRASAEGAVRLYEQAGFSVVGLRPKYYSNPTEDGLVMRCGIPATTNSH